MSQLPYALSQAEIDVLDEKRGQRTREGFSEEHDDTHDRGQMADAAVQYAAAAGILVRNPAVNPGHILAGSYWPWDVEWWKPGPARRMLVKAAALILAEIERLDRVAARKGGAL